MPVRRIATIVCALALAATAVPMAGAAEPPPVVLEDASDFTPTLEPDADIKRPSTYALARSGANMYAGGTFNRVKDSRGTVFSRRSLMSFNASSGEVRDFAPAVNGTVRALAASGTSLYVGGAFNAVNGTSRRGLAKIDLATGAVDPAFNARLGRGRVNEIRWAAGRLLVGGTFSRRLVALDPVTGADTGYLDVRVEGTVSSSTAVATGIYSFALNARRTRLVAVGNFSQVNGQVRKRAFALQLRDNRAVVDGWYYKPLGRRCKSPNARKAAYLTDVDFAPRGPWFVLVSTGWVPRYPSQIGTSVCDAAARFELGVKNPSAPTWINYTGGDTLYSVDVTSAAVYVQGHNRWLDNPEGVDSAGPGAVRRRGLGAIDAGSGKALAWNPDKPAVQGGHAFLDTPSGLWVGSDSVKVGGEYHRGLALFEAQRR